MRSQLNKDIQALCLQFNKVYNLLRANKAKSCRKQNIYMFLLNNHKKIGIQTRFHHPNFETKSMHDRFAIELEINKLHTLLDAIAQTLSDMTQTPKEDLQFLLTFHKAYRGAAYIFFDTPYKRISRFKTSQAGRYDLLEQDMLDSLDLITRDIPASCEPD